MKYTIQIDQIEKLDNVKKRLDSEGTGKTYLIVCGRQMFNYKTKGTPDPIILDAENSENDSIVISAITEGRLLGDDFNYEKLSLLTVSELKEINDIGNMFNGTIAGGKLIFSKYAKITDMSWLKHTSITDVNGVVDGVNRCMFAMPNLVKVRMPNDISTIGDSSFAFCISLKDILLPSRLNVIESKAFYNCTSLREVTVPASVSKIENYAFGACKNLRRIILKSTEPPVIYKDTFNVGNGDIIVYVPARALETYRKRWAFMADHIQSK